MQIRTTYLHSLALLRKKNRSGCLSFRQRALNSGSIWEDMLKGYANEDKSRDVVKEVVAAKSERLGSRAINFATRRIKAQPNPQLVGRSPT